MPAPEHTESLSARPSRSFHAKRRCGWGRIQPAYAAALWGALFAIPHILWAVGWFDSGLRFSLGLKPGAHEEEMINDPAFTAYGLWGVAALCLLASIIALSTIQPWGKRLPRWVPAVGTWGVCVVLAIRGLVFPGILGSLAIELNIIALGPNSDPVWNRWNVVLWSPWFLLGATLFARTAIANTRFGSR